MFIPKLRIIILAASLALLVLGVVTGSTRTANAESTIGTQASMWDSHPLLEPNGNSGGWQSQAQIIPNAGGPVGSSFTISAGAEQEASPSVAYNTQAQEYLVAWYNDLPGNDDIHVERVSKTGKLLKHKCVACGVGADRRYPDVAYNSQRNQYLVVWLEEASGQSRIQAQLLSANAEPVGGVISLYNGTIGVMTAAHPAVGYASTPDKYLVVWELEINVFGTVTTNIVGHGISASGTPDPSPFAVSADSGGSPRRKPDVAYNRHANGYLVVWQQMVGAYWTIYGQLVHGDGTIIPGTLPVQISPCAKNCTAPAVAAIPTATSGVAVAMLPAVYKYLVVWEYEWSGGDRDIYGRLLEENGTPSPSTIVINNSGNDESDPAVGGDESARQYLVAWSDKGATNTPIHTRTVDQVGNLTYEGDFGGPAANYPAVAAGPIGDLLIAWQDQPAGASNTNLYGRIWGNRWYLPLMRR